ncbi:MAG TPA: hypothetical protein VM492_18870, partial [Sumerlaeia bacterium]|nr:hypothetical protein [Sumerlaeia bacterium]
MANTTAGNGAAGGGAANAPAGIQPGRLFLGSCMSLVSTSVAFGVITSMMGDFKSVFALSS